MRDIKKATHHLTDDASLRIQSIAPFKCRWESAEVYNSIHQRPDASDEEATQLASLHSDPSKFMSPRDTLAPPIAEEPIGSTSDGICADASARRGAARRVRFAAQLEEDPPAALHSPRLARAGGRGAYAARMLRAVSRSLARALRRAPG